MKAEPPALSGHQLVAPNEIGTEALDLLLGDVRLGARSESDALKRHQRMTEIRMSLIGDRASRRTAWQIARENDWDGLRDAEYLAVTRLQTDALVTVDSELAAKAAKVVPLASIHTSSSLASRAASGRGCGLRPAAGGVPLRSRGVLSLGC